MQHQEVTLAFSHQKLFLFLNTSHFHKPQMLELNLDLFLPVSLRATSAWNTPVLLSVCVLVCVCRLPSLHYSTAATPIHFFPLPLYNYKLLLSPLFFPQIPSLSPLRHSFILLFLQDFYSARRLPLSALNQHLFFSHLRLSFRFNVFYFGFTKNWTLWLFCSLLFPSLPCCVAPSSLFLSLPLISFLLFPASFLTIHWIPTILSSSKRGSWRE